MLRCNDGSLYTGWTNDLKKRYRTHSSGKGAKYTRAHLPVQLVYYECFSEKRDAESREAKIKRLSKAEKEELVRNFSGDLSAFTENSDLTNTGDCV